MVLLLGTRETPLPAMVDALARARPEVGFAYLCTSFFAEREVVQRVRAAAPALVVLVADVARVATFEALVRTDQTLCRVFGKAAPRVWAMVRGGGARAIDARDLREARAFLELRPMHARDAVNVRLGDGGKGVKKLAGCVERSLVEEEEEGEGGFGRRKRSMSLASTLTSSLGWGRPMSGQSSRRERSERLGDRRRMSLFSTLGLCRAG